MTGPYPFTSNIILVQNFTQPFLLLTLHSVETALDNLDSLHHPLFSLEPTLHFKFVFLAFSILNIL